jgi:hypothetical protein
VSFPNRCFRGILKKDWVFPRGGVDKQIFKFEPSEDHPGCLEASIYWDDDEKTIEFAKSQTTNDGSPAHEGGLAQLLTIDLKNMKKLPIYEKCFKYERAKSKKDPRNIYHGNIVLGPGTDDDIKEIRKRAVPHLADLVKLVL